MLYVVIIL